MWAFAIGAVASIVVTAVGPNQLGAAAGPVLIGAGVLVVGGLTIWGALAFWEWTGSRWPSSARREMLATEASRLGLRSVERDASLLDLSFPFLRSKGAGYFVDNFNRWFSSLMHPTFDWIFAGPWRGREVRVFEYSLSKGEDREEWTCAQLAIDANYPEIEIANENIVSRIKARLARGDITLGDEPFDRAFQIRSPDEAATRRLFDPATRARLLAIATTTGFVMQLKGERMLYCCPRIPIESRQALLEYAHQLADALPERA